MYKTIIIKSVREINGKVVICAQIDEKDVTYSIAKKDLKGIQLNVGQEVGILEYPGYPGFVSGLDANGYRIFTKRRENIADEYFTLLEQKMFASLTPIGLARLAMFEKFCDEYMPSDRLCELMAMTLGHELYLGVENEEDIDSFKDLSIENQKMLSFLHHHSLPQIPVEAVQAYAKAYLHDDWAGISGMNNEDLFKSELMHLPNANWENRSKFCEPRDAYIERYISSL
jgi:hypothetical protein